MEEDKYNRDDEPLYLTYEPPQQQIGSKIEIVKFFIGAINQIYTGVTNVF